MSVARRLVERVAGAASLRGVVALATLCLLTVAPWAVDADEFPPIHSSESEKDLRPMPAEEAAAKMRVPEGFRVSLFAAEPEVQNPIAMAWDAKGRLWVAENYTYSDRTQRFDRSMRDRVLIFEDRDNDGRADSRTVFLDDVQILTSVEVGRGGVWLMCSPQLLFVPDADENGVPDGPPVVVLDGFDVAQDNYHNLANGLRWGPDGWLYGRCGHSCPGRLGVPGAPDESRVPIDGGLWRYHPERKVVEVLCHGTVNPWGHDWDADGELFFINTVIGHLWHMTPGSHFKESFGESDNRDVYERMDMIADHYHFDVKGGWTGSRDGKANDLGGGHAHIGCVIYQGAHWPESYRGKLMTINMHGMRANVEKLERVGAGYVGRHEPDFFVSADPFFRGIELSTGPDGNLFVIDWSDTGECHEHTGVHRESGRIFKISYGAESRPGPLTKPACLQGDGALPRLWRDYQAGRTTPESLRTLTRDPNEHVRVWAVRLLTDFWPLDRIQGPAKSAVYPDDPETYSTLLRLAREDESGLMLRVLASTLQRLPPAKRADLAMELVKRADYADDRDLPWLVWYGLLPLIDAEPASLVKIAKAGAWPTLHKFIARGLASRLQANAKPLGDLLDAAPNFAGPSQANVLAGINDALRGWRKAPRPAHWEEFTQLAEVAKADGVVRELSGLFGDGRALAEIRRIALDDKADLKTRQQALESLIEARPDDLRQLCESVLDVRVLNGTAARGLSLFDDRTVAQLLAGKYRRFQPDDRPRLIETLVSRRAFAAALLDVLEKKGSPIPLADVTAAHARQIKNLGDAKLTKRLSEVWGELRESSAERQEMKATLIGRLTPEARSRADLSDGRAHFNAKCSVCHTLFGEGKKIGPDLTGAQRSSLDYLLENIVDPSAVVGKDYRVSIVETVDGRVLSGLVVSKDEQTLKLQTATELLTINQADVAEVLDSPLSVMPDGLLQNMSDDQIRNLIAYLMSPTQIPLASSKAE